MDLLFVTEWLEKTGFKPAVIEYLALAIKAAIIIVVSYITYAIARLVINRAIHRLLKKAPERWYNSLVNSGFFKRCANCCVVFLNFN